MTSRRILLIPLTVLFLSLAGCKCKGPNVIRIGDSFADARAVILARGGKVPSIPLEPVISTEDGGVKEYYNVYRVRRQNITLVTVDGMIQSIMLETDGKQKGLDTLDLDDL